MNKLRICAVQDLSHILSAKSLQHETLASTNTFKRCLWSFLDASHKEENACETKKINSFTVSHDPEPIPAAWMTLNFRLPMTFFQSEINTEVNRLEALQSLAKYNDLLSLLDKSSSKKKCHTILPNVLIGDFGFVCDNNKVAIDKTDYRDRVLTIFSTHQKNQAPVIDLGIEQARTNNSSARITAKNINNFSLVESQFKKPKINQQHSQDEFKDDQFSQKRNLSQSSELQFRDVKRQDFRYMKQQQTIVYFTSLRNQGSQKLSSYLTFMPRCVLSTKSCIVIQKSIETTSRKDLNVSSIPLKSAQSHSGCVSLQLFSHNASKSEKSADCKEHRRQCDFKTKECDMRSKKNCEKSKDVKSHKKTCSRQKDTRNEKNVSCQNEISKKRRKNESESCEHYVCPQLKRKFKCWSEKHPGEKSCDSKGRDATKNHMRQSRDSKCSQKQDNSTICKKTQRFPTCERRETREAREICTDPSKKKNDCGRVSKHKKTQQKGQQKCTGNNRGQSKSYKKRDSSYDRNKADRKRHYSQQSIFSVSRNHRSFSTLIPDIVLGTNEARKTTHRFYASCGKDEKNSKPSYDKPNKKFDTDKKDEIKKKCVKDPPKCLTKKSIPDEKQTCQSTSKDKDTNSHEPTQKTCYEEYCSNRKEASTMKGSPKPKEESAKERSSPVSKNKKPADKFDKKSIKEQIDREYREIEECKKTGKEIKKNDKKKDDKKNDKIKKMSAKSIARNSTGAIHKSPRGILDGIPIIARDVRLFDIMFDRSFSTTKVNYQDDFAIERTAGHSKMVRRCSANNSEFIQGDELPSYIEVENEEEEDDEYDLITGRPILGLD